MGPAIIILLILVSSAAAVADKDPVITSTSPKSGSLNGETLITLRGQNLHMDLADRNKINAIRFVFKTYSKNCRLHENGCTSGITLQCYTPKFSKEEEFSIAVVINNKRVPAVKLCPGSKTGCTFRPSQGKTPTITSIAPRSGPPGTLVTICGRLFTDLTQSNKEDAETKPSIRRVYIGGDICQLNKEGDGQVDTDNLYGIELNNNRRDGCIKCKPKSTFVGNYNASFIVSKDYGRSKTQLKALHMAANNKIGTFQAFAEIENVEPPDGSIMGETLIKITGKNFDANASVKIAGEHCVVEKWTETEITCVTPAKQPETKIYSGNRGLKVEVWRDKSFSYDDVDKIANLTSSDGNYTHLTMDAAYIDLESMSHYVTRMSGYFVPPASGNYQLMIKADDLGKLYVENEGDLTLVSTVKRHINTYAGSEKVLNLTGGQAYYFKAFHAQGQGPGHMSIGAKLFNSKYTPEQVGEAVSEIQEIKITSYVVKETQVFSVLNWEKQTQVNEVQEIVMSGDGGTFQIKVDGAATVLLRYPPVDSEVKAAVNDLPTIYPEAVEVTSTKEFGKILLKVEFISGGDKRLMEFVPRVHGLTGTVREVTKGRSNMDMMQLEADGVPSVPFPSDADKPEIREAILSMFSVRCPRFLDSPKNVAESQTVGTKDYTTSFCGLASLKNPTVIFKAKDKQGVRVSQYKFLCFAHRGMVGNPTSIQVAYTEPDEKSKLHHKRTTIANLDSEAGRWTYKCINIYQAFERKSAIKVKEISVVKPLDHTDVDLYVDNVVLAEKEVVSWENIKVLDTMRLSGPEHRRISEVTIPDVVDKMGARAITVVLEAVECSHGFPLIVPYNSEKVPVNNGLLYREKSWPADVVMASNITKYASPPVTGKFSLSFNGKQIKDIGADATENDMKYLLQFSGLGNVDVKRKGTCAGYSWTVKFLTLPGDQPTFMVAEKKLKGVAPAVEISTVEDGGLMLDPIPGDMLRTPHSVPQVSVNINDIPSSCKADGCNFEWKDEKTPVLVDVTPATGTENDVLKIKGSGFTPNASQLEIKVGQAQCDPETAKENEVTCRLKGGPSGRHKVGVSVVGKGKAKGSQDFSYTAHVTEVKPASASKGGGAILTLSGTGLNEDVEVKINGEKCERKSINFNKIECEVPQGSKTGEVPLVVLDVKTSGTIHTGKFEYTKPSAIIKSVNDTSASVDGMTPIEIKGTGFDEGIKAHRTVLVGNIAAPIVSWSDTEIVAKLDKADPGSYPLKVKLKDGVYADEENKENILIKYEFEVNSMSSNIGSEFGGADILLAGKGFPQDRGTYDIKFGRVGCDVISVTSTQIHCKLDEYRPTSFVDISGTSDINGKPQVTEIEVGDRVQFSWESPEYVGGLRYAVCQTETFRSTSCETDGFNSGRKTSKGSFVHRFQDVGSYFWIGYIGDDHVRGIVKVHKKTAMVGDLSVVANGIKAKLIPGGTGDRVTRDAAECPTVSQPANCTVQGGPFSYTFAPCATPTITSFHVKQKQGSYIIELQGVGFGDQICQHTAEFLDQKQNITGVTSNKVIMDFIPDKNIIIGLNYILNVAIRLTIKGIGIAAVKAPKTGYIFRPIVHSSQPAVGSCAGGTTLEIHGMHFVDTVGSSVEIQFPGAGECTKVAFTQNKLKCKTPALVDGREYTVSIRVRTPSTQYDASGVKVNFKCGSSETPKITSVTPDTTDGNSDITVNGENFGQTKEKVSVYIGDIPCTVKTVTETAITCHLDYTIPGTHQVLVSRDPQGSSIGSHSVTLRPVISTMTPRTGSVNGGVRVKITGKGFVAGSMAVKVGSETVTPTVISHTELSFEAPPHSSGEADVSLKYKDIAYQTQKFKYSQDATPDVTSISPTEVGSGSTLTISGTGFNKDCSENEVKMCGRVETATSCSETSITCEIPACLAGNYPVDVFVKNKGMATSSAAKFLFPLRVSSMSPDSGSFGGGQSLHIQGQGIVPNATEITLCGNPCTIQESPSNTPTMVKCSVPANTDDGSGLKLCDLTVASGTARHTHTTKYSYKKDLTPNISKISPLRGGTGGGTAVTITGSGFGTQKDDVSVVIGRSSCTLEQVSDTSITCVTSQNRRSEKVKVTVAVKGKGHATGDNFEFNYIDVWSSPYTWGGSKRLPVEGDMVVVKPGQTLLVDTDTAKIKMLLIQGGTVIFDEKDVNLHAENILITNGGTLQIGTEDQPFQHKATITMHGDLRAPELPIYGAKALGVREGTLDLHGKRISRTWTLLNATAAAGSSHLVLEHDVSDWEVGSRVVIATTSNRHGQKESEVHYIKAISGDGKHVTLREALKYEHLGVTISVAGRTLCMAAEVGLLSHNVIFKGSNDRAWHTPIPPCPDEFDTGEFATQKCFQGRFGNEMGSDQFGGHILIHAPDHDKGLVTARIENVELTYVGQAFRLGRYPIHFHLNGNQSGSYVKNCAIHHTFNRAVNIHGTHNVLVEGNVAYDVMGGAFFLEDGIETNNIFQYNLAVFVKSSTSLLNDDVTPAAFWVTNPNNIIRHNHAAGGTHFGFWYRMHKHPDGPSFTTTVCPQNVPLGEFTNNTVHSQGWFGLWIFQKYYPMEGGGCNSNVPKPAKFQNLYTWHCEKGAEWVSCGSCQFVGFVMVDNEKAGVELKLLAPGKTNPYNKDGPVLSDSLIIGHSSGESCTKQGLVLPFQMGLTVSGVTFANFDRSTCTALAVTRVQGICSVLCGGWEYQFESTTWINSPNRITYAWEHEGQLRDLDGTLTGGNPGRTVLPTNGLLPTDKCKASQEFSGASVCEPDITITRFSFNKAAPKSLNGKDCVFTNRHGSTVVPYLFKRITHKSGWMVTLIDGLETTMAFKDAEHVTNLTYSGKFYGLEEKDCVIMRHNFSHPPDHISLHAGHSANSTKSMVTCEDNYNYDFYYDEKRKDLTYLISGRSKQPPTPKRPFYNRNVRLSMYKCYFKNCVPPPDPHSLTSIDARPKDATLWSDVKSWEGTEAGWGGNCQNVTCLPKENENIKIRKGQWVVIGQLIPQLGKLFIEGTLEINSTNRDLAVEISATHIIINGGRFIAGFSTPGKHMRGKLTIKLRGNHQTPEMRLVSWPIVGAKAIGVFGGLDLHGIPRNVTWTRLAVTANKGQNKIQLWADHDWKVGEEIVITATGFEPSETETSTITEVNGKTLTLASPLKYTHIVKEVNSPKIAEKNKTLTLAAKVGLFTRNIKIMGAEYDNMKKDGFGARVLVSTSSSETVVHKGWARLSHVEFFQAGQLGWSDSYDPRYALAWLDSGDVTKARPSYVLSCSFHHGFSTAIGVFGSNKIPIEHNVVHHSVGPGIIIEGNDIELRHNLVSLTVWPGHYNGRNERSNTHWVAGIQVNNAERVIMEGNSVAGSERTGYRIKGEKCSDIVGWKDNEAHSTFIGILLLKNDEQPICTKVAGFTIWRTWYFGIYSLTSSSMILNDVTMVDNRLGAFNVLYGPGAAGHVCEEKYVIIKDSLFVGDSGVFPCKDSVNKDTNNYRASFNGRGWLINKGYTGIGWFGSLSSALAAPDMAFLMDMSYPTLCGLMTVRDTIFTNYTAKRCGRRNYVISNPPTFEDVLHPVYMEDITLDNVDEQSKVYLRRPDVGKVNPSDCVDMVCDAKRTNYVKDKDGSYLGHPGYVLPKAEEEWNGKRSWGIGYHRIPKVALTNKQGKRMDPNKTLPNKGIIRHSGSCNEVHAWQAHNCTNFWDYTLLLIENLDPDTESRRLSPVAIINREEKFVDLLNGPQDHGWCFGYTCQKRLSTFWALVALGKEYDIYFTSTSPERLRLRLLNVAENESVKVGVYYRLPQRFDAYYQGKRVPPKNAKKINGKEILVKPGNNTEPRLDDPPGTNIFDRDRGLMEVILKGKEPLDIKMSSVIVLDFLMPPMTNDEFYGSGIVDNLAIFLGIPKSKIKIVNAVSEKSRKRRSVEGLMKVSLEIGDGPSEDLNATSSDLTYHKLNRMSAKIIDATQNQQLKSVLGVNVTGVQVTKPAPPVNSTEWKAFANDNDGAATGTASIGVPTTMYLYQDAEILSEGVKFKKQPWIRFMDEASNPLKVVGTESTKWRVSVSLRNGTGNEDSVLNGAKIATFESGTAKFTNLSISHYGEGYILDFKLTSPTITPNKIVSTEKLNVPKRRFDMKFVSVPTVLEKGEVFVLKLKITDVGSEEPADLKWKKHLWTAMIKLHTPGSYAGHLVGQLNGTIDQTNNEITFTNLSFPNISKYIVDVVLNSRPPGYTYRATSDRITVRLPGQGALAKGPRVSGKMKFLNAYADVKGNEEAFESTFYNLLAPRYPRILIDDVQVSEGSVVVRFDMYGNKTNTEAALASIYTKLQNGFSVTFNGHTLRADVNLEVDGKSYGVKPAANLSQTEIIIIAMFCCMVIVILVTAAILVYHLKLKNKKAYDSKQEENRSATTAEIAANSRGKRNQIWPSWLQGNQANESAATPMRYHANSSVTEVWRPAITSQASLNALKVNGVRETVSGSMRGSPVKTILPASTFGSQRSHMASHSKGGNVESFPLSPRLVRGGKQATPHMSARSTRQISAGSRSMEDVRSLVRSETEATVTAVD